MLSIEQLYNTSEEGFHVHVCIHSIELENDWIMTRNHRKRFPVLVSAFLIAAQWKAASTLQELLLFYFHG